MKKKVVVIISIFVVIVLSLALYTHYIDSARVRNGIEPKFTIKTVSYNGDKVTYWGLGYKVVRLIKVSPSEPYKNSLDVKYGSWFMNDNFFVANNSKKDESNQESESALDKVTMTIKEGTLTSATIVINNASNEELRITENGLELIKKKMVNGQKQKLLMMNMSLIY